MPIVTIEDVKPGMTLAEAVRNHQDQLLLDAGRRITEKSIRIFKSWGIRRLAVKSATAQSAARESDAASGLPPDLDARLKDRFSEVGADPLMSAIMQAAARQLAARHPRKKTRHARSS
jgi:hypothetical protein